jgi:hypothetical protein
VGSACPVRATGAAHMVLITNLWDDPAQRVPHPLSEPVAVLHQGRSAGETTHTAQLSRFCWPSQLGPPCLEPTAHCWPRWLPAALDHACLMPANSACSGRWRRLDKQSIQLNAAMLKIGIVAVCFGGPKRGLSEAVHACGVGGGGRGGGSSSSAAVLGGASGPLRAAPPSCAAMAGEAAADSTAARYVDVLRATWSSRGRRQPAPWELRRPGAPTASPRALAALLSSTRMCSGCGAPWCHLRKHPRLAPQLPSGGWGWGGG